MKTPESAVLRACLDYLRIRSHFVARVNNGAFETTGGRWVQCTDVPGFPDIIGITVDGKALAVEAKSTMGRMGRSQEIFKSTWIARGGIYILARSIEDLQANGL